MLLRESEYLLKTLPYTTRNRKMERWFSFCVYLYILFHLFCSSCAVVIRLFDNDNCLCSQTPLSEEYLLCFLLKEFFYVQNHLHESYNVK